jgi:lipopolysaccharide transport system ATP-binding protein
MSAIVVEGVSKKFRLHTDRAHSLKELITRRDRNAGIDQFYALDDVSIEIPEGSMYALVGHNGSGKSTLLRCIAGIYRPTTGSVKVQGRISTLLELGAGFHPDLTGRENVYMNATILGMSKKQIDRVFDDIVEFAGIGDFIDSPVKIYSSGMYVRLGFSVAIHVDPEILIIDEVIAVGDQEFQRRCYEHLYELRRRGVTIVVVTHGMDTVQSMCDQAAWLDHGVLQEEGPAPEIASHYLRRVNDKEAEDRVIRAQTTEDRAEARTQDAASLELRVSDHSFSAVPDRPAVSPVRVTDIRYRDDGGKELKIARSGEPFSIEVHFEADEPIDNPVFGLVLHSINGTHVTGINTKISGVETGQIEGAGAITFSIPTLTLNPGDFRVSVAITDQLIQHFYVDDFQKWELAVREGGEMPAHGLVDLLGTWILTNRDQV